MTGDVDALRVPRARVRAWEFYMAICEAGFTSAHLSVIQTLLTRVPAHGAHVQDERSALEAVRLESDRAMHAP